MKYSEILAYARNLRSNQTEAESFFWGQVRNRKFYKYKFSRQYIIEYKILKDISKYFIVDFYCNHAKLIVEIDGKIHDYQIEVDKDREEILKVYGYSIIRFKNEEVLSDWPSVERKLLGVLIE